MECRFGEDIREIQQESTLEKKTVIPLRVNSFLHKYQWYVWCHDDIFLVDHRLVGPFQFGATGIKKSKYPNIIEEYQLKELENKYERR